MADNKTPQPSDDQNPSDLPPELLEWAQGECGKEAAPVRHPDTKLVVWHLVAKTYRLVDGEKVERQRQDLQIPAPVDKPEGVVLAETKAKLTETGREVHELRVEAEIAVRSPHAKPVS